MVSLKSDGMAIMIVFIGTMIAATFIASIATDISLQTTPQVRTNDTVTLGTGGLNTAVDLPGRELVTLIELYNATINSSASAVDIANHVWLRTATGSDGLLSVQVVTNGTGGHVNGSTVNVSYIMNPDGYLSDGGARAINRTTLIMAALAIVVFVIVVFIGSGSLGNLMREK